MVHGAVGGVGSIAVQLAHDLGARVIGTGRAGNREVALGLGTDAFVVCARPAEGTQRPDRQLCRADWNYLNPLSLQKLAGHAGYRSTTSRSRGHRTTVSGGDWPGI
jgi:hypothetical protein